MQTAQTVVGDNLTTPPLRLDGVGASGLQAAIRDIILDKDTPAFDKRRKIRDLVERAILSIGQGFLCQTSDGRGFYFHKAERRLYDLEQRAFQHLLSSVSGLSATETQFRFVLDALQTEAARTKSVEVHTFSYYSTVIGRLVVSDGAGGVWRRERHGKWKAGYNGDDEILFLTEPDAQSWTPEFKQDGGTGWLLSKLLVDDACLSPDEKKHFSPSGCFKTFSQR